MSFYRNVIAAVAAMSLATCVFADETTTTTSTDTTKTTAQAPADATTPATTTTESTTEKTTTTAEKVDLNKATAKELMKVKGISAARAKAIVTYRKKHGDFKAVEDLKEVKGFKKMNEKTMQQVAEQLTVG
ncbi:MAG: helix-hairpin-helix domain-containing protein [Gammaproteobacteria bacterium]|nr:helix-hairpin-helix domain-containing protein [Gammaproteobacteria bacterium]